MASSSTLLSISEDYTFSTSVLIFILGIVGNLLNILIFTKFQAFRNNQCVFYFIIESIVNTGAITFQSSLRLLTMIYGSDLSQYSSIWCKLRTIIGQTFLLLSLSSVCFNAIDQYLSTNYSPYIRRMSTLKLARRLTILSVCFSLSHSIGFGIFFAARSPVICAIFYPILLNYYSYIFYPILCGILPIFIAGLFSLLSYGNVRRITRRHLPIARRRLDRQLTKFVLTRVGFLIILLTPVVIYRIYEINIYVNPTDYYRLAIERLILAVISSSFNLNYSVKFDFFYRF
jgi:hypothetical protein